MHRKLIFAAAGLAALLALGAQEPESSQGPQVGSAAPSFRLNDQDGKAVAFGGESDHWRVLAFFPKAATPG